MQKFPSRSQHHATLQIRLDFLQGASPRRPDNPTTTPLKPKGKLSPGIPFGIRNVQVAEAAGLRSNLLQPKSILINCFHIKSKGDPGAI